MRDRRKFQGEIFKSLMDKASIVPTVLAKELGTSYVTVWRWRHGASVAPWYAFDYLQRIQPTESKEQDAR